MATLPPEHAVIDVTSALTTTERTSTPANRQSIVESFFGSDGTLSWCSRTRFVMDRQARSTPVRDRWHFPSANVTIDVCISKPIRKQAAHEQMIQTHPGVASPCIAQVVPERVHRFVGMQRVDRISPTLRQKAARQAARGAGWTSALFFHERSA